MSSIDKDSASSLAGALFDESIVPLADRRRLTDQQEYFPLTGQAGATTYFNQPQLPRMRPADFEFPGGGTAAGLLDALRELWIEQGELDLAALVPQLKMIAQALRKEPVETNGDVSIFCYTMY